MRSIVSVLPIKKTLQSPKADLEKRSMFCGEIQKLKDEGRTIAYIDESGFAQLICQELMAIQIKENVVLVFMIGAQRGEQT